MPKMVQEALIGAPKELKPPTRREHFATGHTEAKPQTQHHASSEQLPMFMSANEIRSGYQAWWGDRKEKVEHHTDVDGYESRQWRVETDNELYDRKADEASLPKGFAGGGLHEALAEDNFNVENPVNLETPSKFDHWDVQGPQGGDGDHRPQVFNGHHRIAVMEAHAPNKLMPVLHYKQFEASQKSEERRYFRDYERDMRARGSY